MVSQGLGFFFFNETPTTEIYTLSLHDALPIFTQSVMSPAPRMPPSSWAVSSHSGGTCAHASGRSSGTRARSEEHTSELQSQFHLVCRLLLEKKKKLIKQF